MPDRKSRQILARLFELLAWRQFGERVIVEEVLAWKVRALGTVLWDREATAWRFLIASRHGTLRDLFLTLGHELGHVHYGHVARRDNSAILAAERAYLRGSTQPAAQRRDAVTVRYRATSESQAEEAVAEGFAERLDRDWWPLIERAVHMLR